MAQDLREIRFHLQRYYLLNPAKSALGNEIASNVSIRKGT
jgi:hypothetical protein